LAAVLAAFAFVGRYGVEVPFWDEWEVVRMLREAAEGTLAPSELLAQHNEHRVVVPRLITLFLAGAGSYYVSAHQLIVVGHLSLLVAYCYAAVRAQLRLPVGVAPLWFVPVAWLLLNGRQAECLLWGFTIGHTLPLTAAFVALFHLQGAARGGWRGGAHAGVALLAGLTATLSSAMGLLVWPCGAVLVCAGLAQRRRNSAAALSWLAVGCAAWVGYFLDYRAPAHHVSVGTSLGDPLRLAWTFLQLCGAWATQSRAASGVVGGLLLGVLAASVWVVRSRRQLGEGALWLAFGLFCLATLGSIAIGRAAMLDVAKRSSYTTYSLPLAAVVVVLLAAAARGAGRRVRVGISLALLAICVGAILGYRLGLRMARIDQPARAGIRDVLVDFRNRSEAELALLYGDVDRVRDGAEFLAARRWSTFATRPANPRRLPPNHYHFGDLLRFGARGNARPYLGAGWSGDEAGFVWSDGPLAQIAMVVDAPPAAGAQLDIDYAMARTLAPQVPAQQVHVSVNGRAVGAFTATGAGHASLAVPADAIRAGALHIDLRLPDALVPAAAEAGGDPRQVAIAVSSLRLSPRAPAAGAQ
jgi:hypothetical protein